MSLRRQLITPIPEETERVARAAFPKGNGYMAMREKLGTIYKDELFADLFPRRGQPAEAPWRLALVTVFQFAENLTDRQAADAVRSRIDWKCALGLELTDPGFHYSVLSEFRGRLLEGQAEQRLLEAMLSQLVAEGLVRGGGRQRTDSTHILADIRLLNRLELVRETLYQALEAVAELVPEWLKAQITPDWFDRYSKRLEEYRLPKKEGERLALAEQIGRDGLHLLSAAYGQMAPLEVRRLKEVETLRQIWVQNYYQEEGQLRWRARDNLPPGATMIVSPHDLDARYSIKRSTQWTGYKVHLTETCDADRPCLITHVETTPATTQDVDVVDQIHEALAEHDLLPDEHLLDMGYISSDVLVSSQQLAVDLIGPVRAASGWQAHTKGALDLTRFEIDWDEKTVKCPEGKFTYYWREHLSKHGKPAINAGFKPSDCRACPCASLCTRNTSNGARALTFPQKEQYLALQAARDRQTTAEFKEQYQARAGVEGVISQAVFTLDMRRTRYRGQAKTHLQHLATAVAINLARVFAWWQDIPRAKTRVSHFAALAA